MPIIHSTRALGGIIRGRRHDLGRSQANVATSAGVSRPWLAQVEAGKETAEVGLILRVLDTLGLDLEAGVRGAASHGDQSTMPVVDLDALLDEHRRS